MPVHFVPTMGSLHKGHCQLIKEAKDFGLKPCRVLVSVFVNPLQFGPKEDFKNYPRDLEKDCLIASRSGAHALWAPSFNEVYPKDQATHIQHPKISLNLQSQLCAAQRPDHFDGVIKVMTQLLNIVRPQLLVLGEKDWQQLIILRQLIKDLDLHLPIHSVGTVRDPDGLACSSRNQYLNLSEREKALAIPKFLSSSAQKVLEGSKLDLEKLRGDFIKAGLVVEYLEAVDSFTLEPVQNYNKPCLLAAAVHCGKTRLIDHTFLMSRKPIVAIDGPAGAGKSTVTRKFASKLGLLYLDTGAMYRAFTWLLQSRGIDPLNELLVEEALKNLKLTLDLAISGTQKIQINNIDVTEVIRTPEVTELVSTVAAQSSVRKALTHQQKNIGKVGGLVAEGRDIGTTVFPDADLKIFLTASPAERARRRATDMKKRGFPISSLAALESQINQRDKLDSTREISPLIKAQDAIEVITDGMDIEEVVNVLDELFRLHVPFDMWKNPS